jgi:hypothetical protein
LKQFMGDLISLSREDFARVMRVVRNTVDATRLAVDDPTGAYTALVAALESLSDDNPTQPVTWAKYPSRERKIFNAALEGESPALVEKIQAAILEADRIGVTSRFVSSTLARVSPAYYRTEAIAAVNPPRSADLERMLRVAYDIRSKREHVLEDLGDEAWGFTDGAETVFEPRFRRSILTLSGLWRLARHVARRFVSDAPKVEPAPWDYRNALPGFIQAQLAPQYWVSQPDRLTAETAGIWFNGVVEALISWYSDKSSDGINLMSVCEKIEQLAPTLPDGDPKTAMVGIYALWHEWANPEDRRPDAEAFLDTHKTRLDSPSPISYTVGLVSNRGRAEWSVDQWSELATARRAARISGKETPLPAAIDTLLQLDTADQLEAAGRHDDAIGFASNTVEEYPGHEDILAWESRLVAGDHDPNFRCHKFLFGKDCGDTPAETPATAHGM